MPDGHLFSSEPIIGYRCFRYGSAHDTNDLFRLCSVAPEMTNPFEWALKKRLLSASMDSAWVEYQPMVADCNGGYGQPHTGAAIRGCGCGLWAMKTKKQAREASHHYGAMVVGEVALWGHFVEHQFGWRAEYAYPQRLYVIEPWNPTDDRAVKLAESLLEQYGVPVEVWRDEEPKRKKLKASKPSATVTAFASGTSASFFQTFTSTVTMNPFSAAPEPVWPAAIVHPSELFKEITVPKAADVWVPELPF